LEGGAAAWVMARKTKPTTDAPTVSRAEWELAFMRKVDDCDRTAAKWLGHGVIATLRTPSRWCPNSS
jgi:hypothetical protein